MAVDTRELRQKRANLVAEARKYLEAADARGSDMTAEEQEAYERIDAEVDQLGKRIDREERQLQHEADLARAAQAADDRDRQNGGPANRGLSIGQRVENSDRFRIPAEELERRMSFALQGWLRAMKPDARIEAEHLDAAKFFGFDLRTREIELPIARDYRRVKKEYRDMSLTAAAGGYTVPQGFVQNLEQALLQFGGVRQVADVIRTTSGNDLPWPTMNDTSNKGAILSEATTFGTSVDPTFASVIFKAFKYSSKPIIVSNELLEDSAFDLSAMIGGWLGTRIGRIQNDHFTTGGGTTLPKGLTVAGSVGVTAASTTVFTSDEVIDLEHSVDPAYRPGASWMMNDLVLSYIRKLTVAVGTVVANYLWQPGLQTGQPDRILGYPYVINQSMSSTFSASEKLLLFGDMSKYKIRDVNAIRLVRLDELFAQTDQVGFVAFLRTDGNLLDAGTKPVKWLALHA